MSKFIDASYAEEFFGDLEEVYRDRVESKNKLYATLMYWVDVIHLSIGFLSTKTKRNSSSVNGMLINQLKTAYRNFFRYKLYSLINLSGFVVCLVSLSFIFLHIREESGYDLFHSKSDQIYRLIVDTNTPTYKERNITTGFMVAEYLKEFPEIEHVTRVWNDYSRPMSVVYKQQKFIEQHVYYTDTSFFDVFDVEMIVGDTKKALSRKDGLIISEEMATKYFGKEDPLGEVINIVGNESSGDHVVMGVAKRFPKKSHFHFDFLASTESISMWWKKSYATEVVVNYAVLKLGTNINELEEKIQAIVPLKIGPQLEKWYKQPYEELVSEGYWYKFEFQALKDIYLYSDHRYEMEPLGSISELRIIGLIGIFILILAIINYVNISTANASLRLKEIGIRTVLGSSSKQLAIGFLLESFFLSSVGLILALSLITILLPWFNHFTHHSIHLTSLFEWSNMLYFIGLSWFIGVLSGIYPALALSRIYPIVALKGVSQVEGTGTLRNILVVIQFSVSLFLIIATLVVSRQLDFIQNQKLGFDKNNLIAIDRSMADLDKLKTFNESIQNISSIDNSAITTHIGQHVQISTPFYMVQNDPSSVVRLNIMKADEGYHNTMNLNLLKGRWFSNNFKTDSMSVILNAEAIKTIGLENPIGAKIFGWLKTPFTIVGVVDNFHFESLHSEVKPLGILSTDLPWDVPNISYVVVKTVNGTDYQTVLDDLNNVWDETISDRPFRFKFMDDHINSLYEKEQQTASIFKLFSTIAIFIAILGLFGLVTFVANRRLKEIGIRKVLGAPLASLYKLLSLSLSKPILISMIIATPLSFFFMEKWLQAFAYRINFGFQIPLIATLILGSLVISTISYTIVAAASKNPVDILRDE